MPGSSTSILSLSGSSVRRLGKVVEGEVRALVNCVYMVSLRVNTTNGKHLSGDKDPAFLNVWNPGKKSVEFYWNVKHLDIMLDNARYSVIQFVLFFLLPTPRSTIGVNYIFKKYEGEKIHGLGHCCLRIGPAFPAWIELFVADVLILKYRVRKEVMEEISKELAAPAFSEHFLIETAVSYALNVTRDLIYEVWKDKDVVGFERAVNVTLPASRSLLRYLGNSDKSAADRIALSSA
ncbi:hypothetical protein F5146DRAFT_1122728 [Armillaria mellea]|nr:hypothetical protein F5146DRAFT_1122728 [Armillaria mellea]